VVAALALAGALGCSAGPLDVATLQPESLQNGLVAHWMFDEGTGAVADDSSGNGRTGSILGTGWTWVGGRFGGALHFSGVDQVTVPGLPQATQSYTVAGWVLFAAGEFNGMTATLLSTEAPGGGWALFATAAAVPGKGNYNFRYWDSPILGYSMATCECLTMGAWTHLAGVVDGVADTITLYVNGVAQATVATSGPIQLGATSLAMGRSNAAAPVPGPAWTTGALDDVAIYDRALVAQEIADLVQAPAPNPM